MERSNQGHTMTLHTYTPYPMSLPRINFLHLMVSEIHAGQTSSRHPPTHPDTMGENNTPTALKGCGVKTIPVLGLIFSYLIPDSQHCLNSLVLRCLPLSYCGEITMNLMSFKACVFLRTRVYVHPNTTHE